MGVDIVYFVTNLVGAEIAELIGQCSNERAGELINIMQKKTGLHLTVIMNCVNGAIRRGGIN